MQKFLKKSNLGKVIVVSDIHGNWDALSKIQDVPEYHNPEYTLVFNGDFTDGGDSNPRDPKRVMDFIVDEVKNHNAIAIHGNHDDMLYGTAKLVDNRFQNWKINDMNQTLEQLGIDISDDIEVISNQLKIKFPESIEMLDEAPYALEDEHRLFVHAGVNWLVEDYHDSTIDDLIWSREAYLFSSEYPELELEKNFINNEIDPRWHENTSGKVIITGHTPTFYLTENPDNPVVKMQNNSDDLPKYDIDGGSHGFAGAGLNLLSIDIDGSIIRTEKLFGTK
jgi:serine/threonine protein phosphatase 1